MPPPAVPPPAAPPSADRLPAAIGRYRPLALLGSGGMGTVYRAHDPLIDRMVAIKLVRLDALAGAARAEYLDRFRREAQAAGRCAHPAIVAVYDVLEDESGPAIVMELVEGRSLAHLLRERPPPPIAAILGQVLAGLGYAHRLGVTHRDIKPANILVTPSGQAKIADFGIARLGLAEMGGSMTQGLTQAGAMLGTPSYMAPEQLGGEAVDHRADLFATGAVLYEALAGRPPFAGRSAVETMQRLAGPDPASMVAIEAAGAGAYVPVLRQALAKDRERRFASAEAFARALAAAAAAPPPSAEDATRVRPAAAPPAGRWDPALLARVERALAQHVGPVARRMVSEAAAAETTAEGLYQALARSLRSTTDRSAFLRALGGARLEPTLAGARPTPSHPGTAGSLGVVAAPRTMPTATTMTTMPPAALAAAQAALAQFIGPMARLLARQAAEQATSPGDFIERLCAHLPRPEESAALRRRLRAEVEPKLRG